MVLPIFGLSVFFHILIILSAVVVNRLRGKKLESAYQTHNMNGGWIKSQRMNSVISYTILTVVFSYTIILAGFAILIALRLGMSEQQEAFYGFIRNFVVTESALIAAFVATGFSYWIVSRLPEKNYISVPAKVDKVWKTILSMFDRFTIRTTKLMSSIFDVQKTMEVDDVQLNSSYWRFFIKLSLVIVILGTLLTTSSWANAQIVEPGFESLTIAQGLILPTAIAFTPDGRIFIAQKGGTIRVIQNGVLLPNPLVTLTDVNNFGDRGLLGLAVDPNFASNGRIYVSYTHENTPGVNVAGPKTGRIARLTVVGNTANEWSKVILVGSVGGTLGAASCDNYAVTADCIPSDTNTHSVGGLRFGPDGMLYATLGDGADFVAVDSRALRAQNIDSLAGKILRINPNGTAPADNPFYNGDPNANRSKVYALGLRNAFRFNFHPTTGQLYIGDVGWGNFEALYRGVPGANYGWPCLEGSSVSAYNCEPSSSTTNPFYEYAHGVDGASIITGSFPSNGAYPAQYDNSLFIADYALKWIKRLELDATGTQVISLMDFSTNVFPVDMVTGPDGNIYYIDIVSGTLNRITHTDGNRRPVVEQSVDRNSGELPLTVAFSSVGTYDPDGDELNYFWNFGDGATSNEAEPTHTYTTANSFNASLTVVDTFGASATRNVTIFAGNQAPRVTITSPASGSLYKARENVTVTAEAFDPEDGVLPASAFSWEVLLHHNVHNHTLLLETGTRSVTFPAEEHDATDVYLEIIAKAVDTQGLETKQSIYMYLDNGIGSGNLVANPSLEIEHSLPGIPRDWSQSIDGSMSAILTYPVSGLEGDHAARIDISSYSNGAAKWMFSPTFVTSGQEYIFTNLYTATRPTEVLAQFTRADGSFVYEFLGMVPAADEARRNSFKFTVPEQVQTATVFHELTGVGSLVVDDFSLRLVTQDDMTPPFGTITNVTQGDVLSGITSIEVEASDDTAVASVQLYIDGNVVGIGDSESPYILSWDTTLYSNNVYVLSARVTDTSDNTFTTPGITVQVNNGFGDLENLIPNGDLETAAGDRPLGWTPGTGGTLTAEYRYPVEGATPGSLAAEVEITQFQFGDTGDARWVHTSVPVTQGTEYTFRTMYKATSISDVIGRYTFADGSDHHFGLLKEIQPTTEWTQLERRFVPPVGAETVTLFHLISSRATLTIDNVELYATGVGEPSEINPPVIEFIYPRENDTVSGVVTLVASSSDDTDVIGVYFAVNGSPYGPEDFEPPYQTVWNTTLFPDGEYLLKATSHDVYGNNDKVEIWVTVDNSGQPPPPNPEPGPPTGDNLVSNSSLEIVGATGDPLGWNRGGWGVNERSFTYPVTGFSGSAARVALTSYSSGDAKWYFEPVAVQPSTEYTVSNYYLSDVSSAVVIQHTLEGGSVAYEYLTDLPSANAWTQFTNTVTTPANATHLTVFHIITSVGSLSIDDAGVFGAESDVPPPPNPNPEPPTGNNLVSNSGLEIVGATGDPLGWNRGGWGVNERSFTYPVTGFSGSAARVAITSYSSGDAKWYFEPVSVAPGQQYEIGNRYLSTVPSAVIVQYTMNNGSHSYEYVTSLGVASSWSNYNATVVAPAGATHFTIFHIIEAVGSLTIDNAWVNGIAGETPSPEPDPEPEPPPPNPNPESPTGNNLVSNSGLEMVGSTGDPLGWNRGGWGVNERSFTYPVTGFSGSAARVAITSYSSGDAKWYFEPVPVIPGEQYTFTYRYQATAPANITLAYTMGDGSFTYVGVDTPISSTGWSSGMFSFTPPTGAIGVSVMHILAQVGTLTIDDQTLYSGNTNTFERGLVSFSFDDGWVEHATFAGPTLYDAGVAGTFYIYTDVMEEGTSPGFVNTQLVLALESAGHEIGAHSRSHTSLITLDTETLEYEIAGSRQVLQDVGLNSVSTFAYPYGDYNITVRQAVVDADFTLARGTTRGYNDKVTDRYNLRIQQVDRTQSLAEMQTWIDEAAAQNVWLILMFHQINDNETDFYGITEENFKALLTHATASDVDIITVGDGARFLQ